MSLRDDLLPVVNAIRAIPNDAGVRTYKAVIRSRTWSSGEVGLGTATVADVTITPPPRVREIDGDRKVEVGPITPSNAGGGYTAAQLNPHGSGDVAGVEFYYLLTGPNGERAYRLESIDTARAFHYTLRLEALGRSVPF